MVDYLDSVSLQDLVDQQRVRQLQRAAKAQGAAMPVLRPVSAASSETPALETNAAL